MGSKSLGHRRMRDDREITQSPSAEVPRDCRSLADVTAHRVILIALFAAVLRPIWPALNVSMALVHGLVFAAILSRSFEVCSRPLFFVVFGATLETLRRSEHTSFNFALTTVGLMLFLRPRDDERRVDKPLRLLLAMLGGFLAITVFRSAMSLYFCGLNDYLAIAFEGWRAPSIALSSRWMTAGALAAYLALKTAEAWKCLQSPGSCRSVTRQSH